MRSEALIKNSLVIYAILFFAIVSFSAEEKTNKEISAINQILNERTNGSDAFYGHALAPSQNLEVNKSKSDRILGANQQIMSDLANILTAFKEASEDRKVDAVIAAAQQIDPEMVKNNGAFVTFYDSVPSAAISRILLVIPKVNSKVTATNVFQTLGSYKRSPKPSDHVFEYPSALNLTEGSINHIQGSDSTWLGVSASLPFPNSENMVLKKCRQLLGWRCVTSLYRADSILKGDDEVKLLFISAYDLEGNPDHQDFAKDKRSVNQVTGSTALYFVKESANWVVVFGVDAQWNNGKLSFQGAIQNEFKKDFDRFKERLNLDLGTFL